MNDEPTKEERDWSWIASGFLPPFSPVRGNNDGRVRDRDGSIIADCNGGEARAEMIATLLNDEARRRGAKENQ